MTHGEGRTHPGVTSTRPGACARPQALRVCTAGIQALRHRAWKIDPPARKGHARRRLWVKVGGWVSEPGRRGVRKSPGERCWKVPANDPASAGLTPLNVMRYVRAFWRRKWVVLGVAVLITGLAAVQMMRQPKVYASSTSLIIDVAAPRVLDSDVKELMGDERSNYWFNKEYYATQNRSSPRARWPPGWWRSWACSRTRASWVCPGSRTRRRGFRPCRARMRRACSSRASAWRR